MDDDSKETEGYNLTAQGLILMSTVLLRATNLQLIDIGTITEDTIEQHTQVLADRDELWDGTPITERGQKVVLITMTLMRLIKPVDITTTN